MALAIVGQVEHQTAERGQGKLARDGPKLTAEGGIERQQRASVDAITFVRTDVRSHWVVIGRHHRDKVGGTRRVGRSERVDDGADAVLSAAQGVIGGHRDGSRGGSMVELGGGDGVGRRGCVRHGQDAAVYGCGGQGGWIRCGD